MRMRLLRAQLAPCPRQERRDHGFRRAVLCSRLRRQLRFGRVVAVLYAPAIVLPVIAIASWLDPEPLRALTTGYLSLAIYTLGLFLLFMREADVEYLLDRLGDHSVAPPITDTSERR
jgi:hypothetical protein